MNRRLSLVLLAVTTNGLGLTNGAWFKTHRAPDESLPSPKFWLHEDYPHASDTKACRSRSGRLCDPDAVLTTTDRKVLEKALRQTRRVQLPCASNTDDPKPVPVELAVALVSRMDLSPFGAFDDRPDKAAEVFARSLHDEWGVGVETACGGGGAGVVLFLADQDRALYISRGPALATILTDRRLDRIIFRTMKPLLQQERYKDALLFAIQDIEHLLAVGEPTLRERVDDFIVQYTGLVWIVIILGLAFWSIRTNRENKRTYAKVASQLSDLDRARAEALQGHFRTVSCPICLENFGLDSGGETSPELRLGSDGLPLKLLRCGHVFDETCWAEWVSNGEGSVAKCPICKKDVGGSSDELTAERIDRTAHSSSSADGSDEDGASSSRENRILIQYNHERNFRLERLVTRYPQFIRPQQVQRWTQSTYGDSLARDPSFVNSDPERQNMRSHHSRREANSNSGFGGGSSGGGRGGRW